MAMVRVRFMAFLGAIGGRMSCFHGHWVKEEGTAKKCVLDWDHDGPHQDEDGREWDDAGWESA